MKLNWDTVRRILLAVEALPDENSQLMSDDVPGIDQAEAAYHLRRLLEAGLIEGGCRSAMGPAWCYATSLTWAGHLHLDRVRSDSGWQRLKTTAREKGMALGFDSIATLARWLIEQAL